MYRNSRVSSILFQEQSITQIPYFYIYYKSAFVTNFFPKALSTTPLYFFFRSFIFYNNPNRSIFLPVHFLLSQCSKSTINRGTCFYGTTIFSHLPPCSYSSASSSSSYPSFYYAILSFYIFSSTFSLYPLSSFSSPFYIYYIKSKRNPQTKN